MSVGIVTGASRGLGLALTRALAERSWTLVVDARDGEALRGAIAWLDGVVPVAGDVSEAEHRHALVEAAGERIDLVVSNASLLGPSPQPRLADYPLAELERVYDVNVLAPLALVQVALPRLAPAAAGGERARPARARRGLAAERPLSGAGAGMSAVEAPTRLEAHEPPEVRG